MKLNETCINFFVVLLMSALIGLIIIKVIEVRMNDISINMPTIKLPKPNIIVQLHTNSNGYIDTKAIGGASASTIAGTIAGAEDTAVITDIPPVVARPPSNVRFSSASGALKKQSIRVPSAGTLDTHEERYQTYYKHPSDMNQVQLKKFMEHARFDKMTLKDYENWLLAHATNKHKLSLYHLDNLHTLQRDGKLQIWNENLFPLYTT